MPDEAEMKREMRYGCVISPLLLHLYSDAIIQEALKIHKMVSELTTYLLITSAMQTIPL